MQENKEVLVTPIAELDKVNPKYDGGYKTELSNKAEFLHFLKKYVGAKWAGDLTEDENKEKVHLLIEQLKGGDQRMMHGIQMLILSEKDAARQEGLQEGIRVLVETFQELDIPKDIAREKLMQKFQLSLEAADDALAEY